MKYLLLLTITLFTVSCSTFSYIEVNKLRKGMKVEEVNSFVAISPKKSFEISLPSDASKKFSVREYFLTLGTIYADFYMVFQDDKLIYWGFPYEFNRFPDPMINEIGATAAAEAQK
ncbi:MAG: hypothetical protein HQ472_04940 [Ignavibacteria bacterium]|nr:hypothetical protein [Ignavibacteria bacterium]